MEKITTKYSRVRTIIIDDDANSRKLLNKMLKKHPEISVVGEADSINNALVMIEREEPDGVFLDIKLKGENAFDVLDRLPKAAKVIFVSGYDDYALKAFEIDALDFLKKPFNSERLDLAVKKLLKENGYLPIPAEGNGHSNGNGNGHKTNGNGHAKNGNGHSNGNGHKEEINPEIESKSNGHKSNGNGHTSNGTGHASNGNGHAANGNGHKNATDKLAEILISKNEHLKGIDPDDEMESLEEIDLLAGAQSVGKKLDLDDRIFITSENISKFLKIGSILCITAEKDYSYIYISGGKRFLVLKSMTEWEERLSPKYFVRIHRSTIINLEYVEKIEKWFNYSYQIHLVGMPTPLQMSRRYAARLKERFK